MSIANIRDLHEGAAARERYMPTTEKILAGSPEQSLWNHYSSADKKFHVGLWTAEAGHWRVAYTEDEFCFILEGESIIHDDKGGTKRVIVGDRFVIPAGFSGSWQVPEFCKKIYVIYEA